MDRVEEERKMGREDDVAQGLRLLTVVLIKHEWRGVRKSKTRRLKFWPLPILDFTSSETLFYPRCRQGDLQFERFEKYKDYPVIQ